MDPDDEARGVWADPDSRQGGGRGGWDDPESRQAGDDSDGSHSHYYFLQTPTTTSVRGNMFHRTSCDGNARAVRRGKERKAVDGDLPDLVRAGDVSHRRGLQPLRLDVVELRHLLQGWLHPLRRVQWTMKKEMWLNRSSMGEPYSPTPPREEPEYEGEEEEADPGLPPWRRVMSSTMLRQSDPLRSMRCGTRSWAWLSLDLKVAKVSQQQLHLMVTKENQLDMNLTR